MPLSIKVHESRWTLLIASKDALHNVSHEFWPRLTNHHQIYLYKVYFHGFIDFEFDFLFRKWAALNFFNSACFLKFSPITKQFDVPKYHNLDLLSFYEIASLAHFKILSSRKFEDLTL